MISISYILAKTRLSLFENQLSNPIHWQECYYKVFVKVTYATNMALVLREKDSIAAACKDSFQQLFSHNS